MALENFNTQLNLSISQDTKPNTMAEDTKRKERMTARALANEDRRKRMNSTLFRIIIQRLLTKSEKAKKEFIDEWRNEKAYNRMHKLKSWLR